MTAIISPEELQELVLVRNLIRLADGRRFSFWDGELRVEDLAG